jgi:pilus assembly protein Flp/PilA
MQARLRAFLTDEAGATAIEYGLIVSLMTIVCIAGFVALGSGSGGMWDKVGGSIGAALK